MFTAPKELGRRIRLARKRRGWTLLQTSFKVHLHYGYLSRVERGLKSVEWATVQDLARALGDPGITALARRMVWDAMGGTPDEAA